MTTRLYTHPLCVEHLTPPGHPERPDRIRALDEVFAKPEFDALERIEAPIGDAAYYELAHPKDFLEKIESKIPTEGLTVVDADTSASPKSWEVVKRVTGASMDAVDSVFEGTCDNAFVSMRPPGHHAEKTTAMGFCLVNNIAIAARYAQEKYGAERVAIVDFDVHHGNGTQDIFYDDPSVLFASSHQMPLYPGLPAVENFAPDFLMISAGFDAHHRDPLAGLNLVEDDFDWVTGKLMEISGQYCNNRLVSLLEGGYDLEGLALSASAHVKRLMNG